MDRNDYSKIPEHTQRALRVWVFGGLHPGGFLTAVLRGDLFGAVAQADGENIKALPQITMFVFNRVPGECQGSAVNMNDWPAKLREYQETGVSLTFGPFDPDEPVGHHTL